MLGIDASALWAFFQIIFIDLVLAGDNAGVIGLAAAGLPPTTRRKTVMVPFNPMPAPRLTARSAVVLASQATRASARVVKRFSVIEPHAQRGHSSTGR